MRNYLEKWYIPVILSGILGIIGLMLMVSPFKTVFYVCLGIPFLSLVISGCIGLWRLWNKSYVTGFLQIVATMVLGFIGIWILRVQSRFSSYDYYANNLKLATHVKLEKPMDIFSNADRQSIENLSPQPPYFLLANGYQPGIYRYFFWFKPFEKGIIYLKAYEITQEDALSESTMKNNTAVHTDSMKHPFYTKSFTIYEGDWGRPYSARIEVWFDSEKREKDSMLLSKNYIVEGWMR